MKMSIVFSTVRIIVLNYINIITKNNLSFFDYEFSSIQNNFKLSTNEFI